MQSKMQSSVHACKRVLQGKRWWTKKRSGGRAVDECGEESGHRGRTWNQLQTHLPLGGARIQTQGRSDGARGLRPMRARALNALLPGASFLQLIKEQPCAGERLASCSHSDCAMRRSIAAHSSRIAFPTEIRRPLGDTLLDARLPEGSTGRRRIDWQHSTRTMGRPDETRQGTTRITLAAAESGANHPCATRELSGTFSHHQVNFTSTHYLSNAIRDSHYHGARYLSSCIVIEVAQHGSDVKLALPKIVTRKEVGRAWRIPGTHARDVLATKRWCRRYPAVQATGLIHYTYSRG
ncbi:hypothetical protein CC86DRAFT_432230 [Ophiobolus disseminans]|uniref:Uncharacterized protein n=1 Tax=Ophiobolus disseminans TaxID=1469910 RepID=A0A6A6ZG51_9PLEO|nr:hypothetical protein CC86DRAFT_432230 [Ophiobolus disseminans]